MTEIKITNDGVTYTLEELRQIYECHTYFAGITINLPRVKSFTLMNSREQSSFLKRVFADAVQTCKFPCIFKYIATIEPCKDGNMHLHGMIYHEVSKDGTVQCLIPTGIVMDLCKAVYAVFKRNLKESQIKFSYKFCRASTPMTVVQYLKDYDEYERWFKYMYKQYNP